MDRYVITGLGNIGLKYRNTRHNIGFMVIDELSDIFNIKVKKNHCLANVGEGIIKNHPVVLAKPRTYMNLSGQSIRALMDWYKSDISRLIVIYDDMDLPLGDVRIRYKGSGGTHNGMKSILNHLGTNQFIRIRIGIGRELNEDAVNYVLGRFPKQEKQIISQALDTAVKAITCILSEGIDIAMNKYNSKKDKGDV
ncbi:MAG: aminoacyl-tRNA hydrolase [Clostridia bacterium]|jgi:PTH1 family peptidyl-tRNA hydrolase|nr:aminoacyl-tRNA hydrolase [Clostridia bacterium]MDD3093217.1 aminoacyl-tRNA hydrolase [Clostridia bacterium]MDD3972380.1 aminoacyl-tRNA hydrolase [Clostridia bacterium]MDD4542311.1 aminoacyl-tRNA hydrolase [Clostridia bacterium]HPJ76387.1 aminoacyl-tRNA hydrolase [Clostridia bacterium]